ncbi:MAG: DUF1684 domain-containing protein [Flavobacteriaceae bacterium]|nr:MAG: DUF1684 domain-containing protein [Flavobacteriaceae bacterium]
MQKLIGILICLILWSCDEGKKPLEGATEWQKEMNAMFKDASRSPLLAKDRKEFSGLDFFSYDQKFKVNAKLQRTPDTEFFKMKTNTDDVSEERVYGILSFEMGGLKHKLNVYQGKENLQTEGLEDHLFLPFLDLTNGGETYGGGRYIDLKIPKGDHIEIDFNTAYNPYCAYNERYSCPIVPRENFLNIKVEAGLKAFKSEK